MRAAIYDPESIGRVGFSDDIAIPDTQPHEALVKVLFTGVTPTEELYSQSQGPLKQLGCDVVGIVEREAADGSGPAKGSRVLGRVKTGAWAEYVAVPVSSLAELDEAVSFEQAVALPTSALTALYLLECAPVLGRKVLITAANGAVGHFCCQIGRLMDAYVVGQVRREQHIDLVSEAGANRVVVSEDASAAYEFGPYKLIADAVGGRVLSNCISGMIDVDGVCASYGGLAKEDTVFNVWAFIPQTRASVYAFIISNEFDRKPACEGLARLVKLVTDRRLTIRIGAVEGIDRIGHVIEELSHGGIAGKAVIRMWG